MLKRIPAVLIFALLLLTVGHAHAAKDLPNLFKVNDRLYRGGQPTEAGVQELKEWASGP